MSATVENLGELKVPGLRAHMGDWKYYITFLRLKDVAERVSLAQELHKSKALKDLIQREVDSSVHSQAIKRYLLQQDQRLFNALVIAVYGGTPRWVELNIDDGRDQGLGTLPTYIKGALGVLVLSGEEQLFAVDGQHRVVGIKKAVGEKEDVGTEEVCVIFVSHSNDRKGLQRTRRLFTTLNRYAKPVNKMEIIALDEDDAIAIITRRLLEGYPLLKEFTSIKKGKSIPTSDRRNLTTIVTIYDCLDKFFASDAREWREFKKQRPSDRRLEELYKDAVELWDGLVEEFKPLKELRDSQPKDEISFQYRNRSAGGHLAFRPVGLLMIILVVRKLMDGGRTLKQAVRDVGRAPMNLSEHPWAGLLWDPGNRRMMASGENQRVATRILLHGTGGSLEVFKTNPTDLKDEWAGILGIAGDEKKPRLPIWRP
ncbi:MAG: DGQHR domain-containing protein [Terriglobales bacterium]